MKNTTKELEYKLISNKADLLKYREDIRKLFKISFDREINDSLWEWQYTKNPIGDAVVSLCFDGEDLVGHYAALQIPVRTSHIGERAILSVGSMVHNSYRKYGVFVRQGEDVYSYAKRICCCVIGFPNKNALPGRKKRLQWKIDEQDYVALVTKKQLVESDDFNNWLLSKKDVELDLSQSEFLEWRMSKPGAKYIQKNNCIIKRYGDSVDIVYLKEGYEKDLEDDELYNVLCDGEVESLKAYKSFDYPFGYRKFNENQLSCKFKKDLIMSDVF